MDPPPLHPTVTPVPDDETPTKQNPSSSPADSYAVRTLLLLATDAANADPKNNPELEDPDDQEGMMLSPSRSSRFPQQYRRTMSLPKRGLAFIEKKSEALAKNMKPVPFVPSKVLDFSKHEEGLRKLGLWDFAHLEFDRKVRNDLIAELIINYNGKRRVSYIDNYKLSVNQSDMARALNLPCKKPADGGEIDWPDDFISFVDDFVSSWMLLHEDTCVLPYEVMTWTEMIKEGHPEKVYWAKLIWFMVKRELSKGSHLVNCYYASHLQRLIKCQNEFLLKETVDHVENLEMSAPGHLENLGYTGDVVENLGVVENLKPAADHDENLEMAAPDRLENLGYTGDVVENLKPAVDDVENLDMAAPDPLENLGYTGDVVANLGDVENLKPAVDHVENLEMAAPDHLENLGSTGDAVDNLKPFVFDAELIEQIEKEVRCLFSQPPTHFPAPDFNNHHGMLGGTSSSILGNSSKRGLDLDPDIPTHKRTRIDSPSREENPPDLEIQQCLEEIKLASMAMHKMFSDAIRLKDHLIQQLKMDIDELQGRHQAEIARHEDELYSMNSIIDGYKKALERTQKSFAEYRNKLTLPAAGEGGRPQ